MAKETRSGDGKVSKRRKDPKGPKRSLSAYMFFSQDKRASVKDENPDASFGNGNHFLCILSSLTLHVGQIGMILGQKWKEMSDEEKKVGIRE